MAWAVHPADTVGTPTDPGLWTEAENIGATRVADLLEIAEGQIRAYAPALAVGATVPASYRIATVLQARDNWQASRRVGDSVAVGDTAYAIRVRPISDAIKSMVRPPEGVAGFASGVSTFTPAPAPTVDLSAYAKTADVAAAYSPLGHTHPEPWTYQALAAPVVNSTVAQAPVGLALPALPDGLYEWRALLIGQSANFGTAIQSGFSTVGVTGATVRAWMIGSNGSAAQVMMAWGAGGDFTMPATNAPTGQTAVPGLANRMEGTVRAAGMSGPVPLTFASETAGTAVTILADSFLAYRRIAA